MDENDEVVIGTYEGFLLGYSVSCHLEANKLKQTFATHSHTSSVRCVDSAGKFLASGGTDDKVVIIDMKTRKEHTVLMHHDGTISTLAFTKGGTHLLTGSSDGSIVVIRTGNWQIEKKWKKAHGGSPIDAIAVHPSDKLALSVGGDKTLRTWNLVKGRPAFTINLASKGVSMATDIAWSPGGDRFSIISQQTVDIWTISKSGIEKRITCNSKPSCVAWISDEVIIVGLENGNMLTITVTDTQALTCHAHKHRVKGIFYTNNFLYSASSSGELKLWALSESNCLKEEGVVNTGGRVTCITVSSIRVNNNQLCSPLIKEESTDEDNEATQETVNEADECHSDIEMKTDKAPEKRSTSFVAVQYDNEEEDGPAQKKIKRKKKQRKHFKNIQHKMKKA